MARRNEIQYALLALLTASVIAAVLPSEPGRLSIREARAQASPPIEVAIAAQRLESGHTEFALQVHRSSDGASGTAPAAQSALLVGHERRRGVGSNSGSLELPGGFTLRISARILTDGRIEFSLHNAQLDNQWSERDSASPRMFLVLSSSREWLASSNVPFPQAAPMYLLRMRRADTHTRDTTTARCSGASSVVI